MRVSDWLCRGLALTGVECRARCSAGREVEPAATGTSAGIVQGLGRLWLRLASGSPAIGASGEDGFRHIARYSGGWEPPYGGGRGGAALRRGRYRQIAAHGRASGTPRRRTAHALALFLLAAAHGQRVPPDHRPDGTRRRTGVRRQTAGEARQARCGARTTRLARKRWRTRYDDVEKRARGKRREEVRTYGRNAIPEAV